MVTAVATNKAAVPQEGRHPLWLGYPLSSPAPKKRQTVKQSSKKTTVGDKQKSSATKNKFAGEPRTIAQAKKMGKSYFINKAGKKLAAVTKEDLRAKGLDPNKKSDLTKFLNMKKKKAK